MNDAGALETLATQYKSYAALFVAAGLCTLFGTPLYIRLAVARGWVDRPGGRKAHEQIMPTMGGLVIFVTVLAGILTTLAWGNRVSEMLREQWRYIAAALSCTAVAVAVGVIDDRRGLRAKTKLLVQLLIAVAAYFLGFDIQFITLPGLGSATLGGASLLLTVLWVVGIINAVNFTDGLDGLATGVCFLAAGVNAGVAIWLGNYYMAVMMLLLAGALLGFLRWNFHPARVFLGDAGSLGLGTYLALCSLHSAQKSHTAVMILVPLCALGYPIFDMLLAVMRRAARGQPLWASDHDHIHHRLLARGHSPTRAAITIYVACLILAAACLVAMTANHLAIGLVVAGLVILAIFSVRVLGYFEKSGGQTRAETKTLHAAAHLAKLKLAAARTLQDISAAFMVFGSEAGFDTIDCHGPREAAGSVTTDGTPIETTGGIRLPLGGGIVLALSGSAVRIDDAEVRALLDDLARTATATVAQWPDADIR